AVPAERMRHWRDDPNLALAIAEAIAPRRFARLVRHLLQRQILRHAGDDLIEAHDDFRRPDAVLFERHEFDEAHHHPLFPREHPKRNDLILIESAQEHAIDFYRIASPPAVKRALPPAHSRIRLARV